MTGGRPSDKIKECRKPSDNYISVTKSFERVFHIYVFINFVFFFFFLNKRDYKKTNQNMIIKDVCLLTLGNAKKYMTRNDESVKNKIK